MEDPSPSAGATLINMVPSIRIALYTSKVQPHSSQAGGDFRLLEAHRRHPHVDSHRVGGAKAAKAEKKNGSSSSKVHLVYLINDAPSHLVVYIYHNLRQQMMPSEARGVQSSRD